MWIPAANCLCERFAGEVIFVATHIFRWIAKISLISSFEFGQQVMKWGRGDAEAIARASDPALTKGYLDSKGVTLEMAEQWRDFYINEAHVRPNNPSAKGRTELMQKAVELLGGH